MKKKHIIAILAFTAVLAAAGALAGCGRSDTADGGGTMTLTNVSYDPTRELYKEYNELFQKHYRETTGKDIRIIQSHGGSGSQARSVIEGSRADVVTLALAHDISLIERAGLIHEGWQSDFANDSAPYTSTIVFLVRKGNPKGIRDWDDLVKPGVSVITPDPKSSGGACWNFLAAWSWGLDHFGGNEIKTRAFMTDLYRNVTVMDSGARGSTTTFVENGQGDVLIAWENEALYSMREYPDKFELVVPSISIMAQPSVAVVDRLARRKGHEEAARQYLQYLYSDEAQKLAAKNGFRPSNPDILQRYADRFDLHVKLTKISDFGGWEAAYVKFFNDDALFDKIMADVNGNE
ncbi:sulfate ABC transporter substrate-binding protein [Megasphaera elsdenii]|uniref:sulfate ABC transporter substrate-binding protein n=1 Tax=Megasphaera elsdenii TaxID=907 RepID=UPI002E78836B|nr:sulfate ABC transporter substrate-binding protein [Megasphaera elsdenii]MEE0404175.1 sulfate ABC transporter substrate-binding protein [Megasphaera elsdenii]